MEILEIRSTHDLTTSGLAVRQPGNHSYRVNCRQYLTVQRDWQRNGAPHDVNLCVMTLSLERIWISAAEAKQVEAAILDQRSPLALD